MRGLSYPPAGAVAKKVHEHFARLAGSDGTLPEESLIAEMVSAAFWASLRREEGHVTTLSLAFLPPEESERPMMFEWPIEPLPEALARLAPAVKRPGIHLGVWHGPEGLLVWGTTRSIPARCLVLEVIAPGLLVVKRRRTSESGKFLNVAVLEGEQVKVLSESTADSEVPDLVKSLLGRASTNPGRARISALEQLAVSMRAHARGGALLVVPADTETWKESVVQPIRYSVSPPYAELTDFLGDGDQARFRRAIDTIAGLTVVDGATVITDRYELLAFGVKIVRRDSLPRVERVILTEPIEGTEAAAVHPSTLGGTRHLSAAQFVHDQRNAIALVASQDGRFTVFSWSPSKLVVHAERVDWLLL